MMYNIKLLNKISPAGLGEFDLSKYRLSEDIENPDAIIVRSANMHDMEIPDTLRAVARAGAGVNNIPVDEYSKHGIIVFNTPGANANAVKEIVIAALLLSSRRIFGGIEWVKTLSDKGAEIPDLVEKGKANFKGPEIYGKKLGVIGLGAVGTLVANAASQLGMEVYGYDPYISVDAAWNLSRAVKRAASLKNIFTECDYITLHVPSLPSTKGTINSEAIASMKPGVRILNFARGDLVIQDDVAAGLESGRIACYITDFPSEKTLKMKNTICVPHLGASTPESEDNCAAMAARQLKNFLEYGIIKNSVNFPDLDVPKETKIRMCFIHKNIPQMISHITTVLGESCINIEHLTNKSRKDYAFTFIDIETQIPPEVYAKFKAIPEIISIREIH